MESHKRPFSTINEADTAASSSDAAQTDVAQSARDALMHERRLLESQLKHASAPSWSSAAAQFAAAHLAEATAVRDFRLLCDTIQRGSEATAESSPAASTSDERKEMAAAPTLPSMQTAAVTVKPPILPVMLPASAAASSSSAAAAASPAASPTASSPAASPSTGTDPTDVLVSYSDISLLVPRGKYTLHLCSSGAVFAQPPGPKSQSHSIPWGAVSAVIDVVDVFKRDWYVVITLRKDAKPIVVGKQTHWAVVIKMQANEKLKDGRAKVATGLPAAAKDPESRGVMGRIQALLDAQTSAHPPATLSSSLVASLREIPALAGVPFVAHDPSIFSSQKSLPCVSCKLGVEDGALYFLRTGLLFIKPVMYLPLSELDGITPARGAAGTFDMKVGTVGTLRETAFSMIEPKEEGAITKYCGFLGAEQKRIEKAERREKQAAVDAAAGIVGKAEPAAAAASSSSSSAAAAAAPSSSSFAAAAHAGSSASDAIDLDDDDDAGMSDTPSRPSGPAPSPEVVASLLSSAGLALSDIIPSEAGKRPQRKAKPTSFEGMESEDEKPATAAAAGGAGSSASAKPAAAAGKPAAAAGDDDDDDDDAESDAASVPSSEEEDYSAGSGSESSDSAEYDSDKDAEEIPSDGEGKGRGGAMAASSAEEESEEEQEEEEEEADAGMRDA